MSWEKSMMRAGGWMLTKVELREKVRGDGSTDGGELLVPQRKEEGCGTAAGCIPGEGDLDLSDRDAGAV